MRHNNRGMRDSGSEDDFNYWHLAQEVFEKNFSMCSRYSCDILLTDMPLAEVSPLNQVRYHVPWPKFHCIYGVDWVVQIRVREKCSRI